MTIRTFNAFTLASAILGATACGAADESSTGGAESFTNKGESSPIDTGEAAQALTGGMKIAVYDTFNAVWSIDFNGNGTSESTEQQPANAFGNAGDIPVSYTPGTYTCGGTAQTVLTLYRPSTHQFFVDANNNRIWDSGDTITNMTGVPNGNIRPYSIQYDLGNGTCVSELGVLYESVSGVPQILWYADANTNGNISAGEAFSSRFGSPGDIPMPLLHGTSNTSVLAVYRPSTGVWFIDANANKQWDGCDFGQPDRCVEDFSNSNEMGFASPRSKLIASYNGNNEFIDSNVNYTWDGSPPDTTQHIGNVFTYRVLGRY